MLIGLSHDSKNPDESYTIFFSIRVRNITSTRNLDPIFMRFRDNGDDK